MKRTGIFLLAVLMAGMLQACGQSTDVPEVRTAGTDAAAGEQDGERRTEEASQEGEDGTAGDLETGAGVDPVDAKADPGGALEDAGSDSSRWKQQFGGDCIAEQTFEVELSEYSGKVFFVPYAPAGEAFHMQIIQDGQALADLTGYVPEALSGEAFRSLDAVSFFDINYDGATDILLIETYGDTSFAAVYYGYAEEGTGAAGSFLPQEELSKQITGQASALTVPAIRELLSGGKKNGEFAGHQEAYEAVVRLSELESAGDRTYGLLYVDEDGIPELAAGVGGYYTSLYTYHDGTVYTLMDHWAYGAMGNAGYEYAPQKNSLRNYNSDYAGAILYTTYMEISSRHTLDITAEIQTLNFDDVNGNGVPDEEEMESAGRYSVNYIDGKEVSYEECASYDVGGYEIIAGDMSLEQLEAELKK